MREIYFAVILKIASHVSPFNARLIKNMMYIPLLHLVKISRKVDKKKLTRM